MRDLDRTVAYDLRDLSDEQLKKFAEWYMNNTHKEYLKKGLNATLEFIKSWLSARPFSFYMDKTGVSMWGFGQNYILSRCVNALTLFEPQFKQGDKVLVRNREDSDWSKRVYVVEHNGRHYVESYCEDELFSYRYIKPYEEKRKWHKLTKGKYLSYDRLTETDRLEVDSSFAIEEITDPEFIKHLDANAN